MHADDVSEHHEKPAEAPPDNLRYFRRRRIPRPVLRRVSSADRALVADLAREWTERNEG